MRILCLITGLGTGGAERQMIYLLSFLNEKGIIPDVVTYYETDNDYDVSYINMNRYSVNMQGNVSKVIKLLQTMHSINPDIVLSYCSTPNYIACLYGMLHPKCRIVISERLSRKIPSYAKLLYTRAKAIVANSQCQTNELIHWFPRISSKLSTIINYTDTDQFLGLEKKRERQLTIGVLARYNPQKNIKRFIDAVDIVNKTHPELQIAYYWYGNKMYKNGSPTHNSAYYLECQSIVDSRGITNIHFEDYVRDSRSLYGKFDVICLPSLSEGFSNTLSEALCAGKPLLASAGAGDNQTFIDDGKNGYLFNPLCVEEIANAIIKIATLDADNFVKFQHHSKEKAALLFSKDKFIDAYMNVLFPTN